MNEAQSPPDLSPVNSPQSGKAKSLKARWMKHFKETTGTNGQTVDAEDADTVPVTSWYSNSGPSQLPSINNGHNLPAKRGSESVEPVMPQLETLQLPLASAVNSGLPVQHGIQSGLALQNGVQSGLSLQNGIQNNAMSSPQSTAELQYKLAQAQSQLGVLPNAMPSMTLKQQTDLIKHAIELEQQSQMIEQSLLLYLAQTELAKETNGNGAGIVKSHLNNIPAPPPQICEAGPGLLLGKDTTSKQVAFDSMPLSSKWQAKTSNSTGLVNMSSPGPYQQYSFNARTEVPHDQYSVPDAAKTFNQQTLNARTEVPHDQYSLLDAARTLNQYTLNTRTEIPQHDQRSVLDAAKTSNHHSLNPRAEVPHVQQSVPNAAKTVNLERLPNFSQRRPSFPPGNIPSVSYERRQSYPLDTPSVVHKGPKMAKTVVGNDTECSIKSPGQCSCTQKPSAPSVVSKVSKEMGIQTDNAAAMVSVKSPNGDTTTNPATMVPVKSPNGDSTNNPCTMVPVKSPNGDTTIQALQMLQSSQPYEICKNWLAKHVPMPDSKNSKVSSSVATAPSPQVNSQESLTHSSESNLELDLSVDRPMLGTSPSDHPTDMTMRENDMVVTSTECNQVAEGATKEDDQSTSGALDYTRIRPTDNKCPVCGDVVSGYHYGIYSCESCKGFFKRTVQSKRNERLRCGRGDECSINIDSRKHCAACRFNKCLSLGMKLEAIRGDRQRGGRSMYHGSSEFRRRQELQIKQKLKPPKRRRRVSTVKKLGPPPQPLTGHPVVKQEPGDHEVKFGASCSKSSHLMTSQGHGLLAVPATPAIDPMLVEFVKAEEDLINQEGLMKCCVDAFNDKGDLFTSVCHLMDHQLYTFVKWARTLPLYKQLKTEDQIVLMQRRGLHLMAMTLCFYFIDADNKISLPNGQKMVVDNLGDENIDDIAKRLVETAGRFRGINLDKYQLVCLKGIMLLNPESKGLINMTQVQDMQEQMEDLLCDYVRSQPHLEEKVTGELLLRLSEIERVCQLVREEVCLRKAESRLGHYPLLMELFQDKPSWLY